MKFGVCDFSSFAVTDWHLRRWRLCFLALMTATHLTYIMIGLPIIWQLRTLAFAALALAVIGAIECVPFCSAQKRTCLT